MNIKQLIAELSKCNPTDQAYIWIDGERYPVELVDDMDGYVDLNAKIDHTDIDELSGNVITPVLHPANKPTGVEA